MADRPAASRRAFLGAGAAGAGVAALSALSVDRALAEAAVGEGGGSTSSAEGLEAFGGPAALPPTIPGTLTRTYLYANANGFSAGGASPLAWTLGAYPVSYTHLTLPTIYSV